MNLTNSARKLIWRSRVFCTPHSGLQRVINLHATRENSEEWDWDNSFQRNEGMFTFAMTTVARPGWYVGMQNFPEYNLRGCLKELPLGLLGIFIAKYAGSGKYLLSTKQWPNMYIYMDDNKTGSVMGWNGNPGSQGLWQFTRIRKYTYMMSTAKWPDVYAYMQDTTDAYIMGTSNNPGDKGHFVLTPVIGSSDCKF